MSGLTFGVNLSSHRPADADAVAVVAGSRPGLIRWRTSPRTPANDRRYVVAGGLSWPLGADADAGAGAGGCCWKMDVLEHCSIAQRLALVCKSFNLEVALLSNLWVLPSSSQACSPALPACQQNSHNERSEKLRAGDDLRSRKKQSKGKPAGEFISPHSITSNLGFRFALTDELPGVLVPEQFIGEGMEHFKSFSVPAFSRG